MAEWGIAIVLAVIIAVVIKSFIFTIVLVDGESMTNTLQDKDRLFVSRIFYQPEQGDIVVFKPYKDKPIIKYIKRVIGLGGQTVVIDFDNSTVEVDGKMLNEPYIKEEVWHLKEGADVNWEYLGGNKYSVVVPDDCIFVLGDNRNGSKDSRSTDVGMVKKSSIVGKAIFRVWPFKAFGKVV